MGAGVLGGDGVIMGARARGKCDLLTRLWALGIWRDCNGNYDDGADGGSACAGKRGCCG